MILPDVNILVHSFRPDSLDHKNCRSWLDSVVNGDTRYGMSPQVLSSMVRIVTHPKIFIKPSSPDEVLEFCDVLLTQNHCVTIIPGGEHWNIFKRLCVKADARGNLVQDAWFAALAIESGCEWITLDRDFARFPDLKWRLPS